MKSELIERYRFCHDLTTHETSVKPDSRQFVAWQKRLVADRRGLSSLSIIGGCLVLFHIGTKEEAMREGTKQVMHYNQYGELKR